MDFESDDGTTSGSGVGRQDLCYTHSLLRRYHFFERYIKPLSIQLDEVVSVKAKITGSRQETDSRPFDFLGDTTVFEILTDREKGCLFRKLLFSAFTW